MQKRSADYTGDKAGILTDLSGNVPQPERMGDLGGSH